MGEEKEKKGVDGIRKGINSATIFFMAITWVALRSVFFFFFRLIYDNISLSNLIFFFFFIHHFWSTTLENLGTIQEIPAKMAESLVYSPWLVVR